MTTEKTTGPGTESSRFDLDAKIGTNEVMKRVRVVVLMGGKSPEHEVSLASGREVVKNLNPKKFAVFPVVISRDGASWRLTSKEKLLGMGNPIAYEGAGKELITSGYREIQKVGEVSPEGADVVFIAMHGPYGEDGKVQGLLELSGTPYTGSGVAASALGMDKLMFRKVMAAEGIPIPKYVVADSRRSWNETVRKVRSVLGTPPYFVKPSNQGSSVGASIVRTESGLGGALAEAYQYGPVALIDEYIRGKEVTCGVLGNESPVTLPVLEIRPKMSEFFNYQSKYADGGSEEMAARLPKALNKKIQGLAIAVFQAIGCLGFGRVDFLLRKNRYPVVLEINTIPGLTPMSLLPRAAKLAGISYPKLVERIVTLAVGKPYPIKV